MRLPGMILALCLAPAIAGVAQTVTSPATTATSSKTSVSELFNQGQRAYLAGDVETAKARFNEVLAVNPNHLPSKNYLKMIASSNTKSKGELAKKIEGVTLEKVSFKDATLDSVLAYLKEQLEKASGGAVKTSFVLQLPPDYALQSTVTLELTKMPFTEVLRYIGDLTATKFTIEEYAIVVKKA